MIAMADLATVLAALADHTHKPATAHELRAQPGDIFGHPALTALMQFAHGLGSRAEVDAALPAIGPLVRAADPFRGATIALCCGTIVEWGADAGGVFPHLLAVLPRHLALARRAIARKGVAPAVLFDDDPEAARAAAGLTYLLLATMTVICRRAAYRQALRANAEIVEHVAALRAAHREAGFVAQVLDLTDDMELIVLAPAEQKGFRVALEAVASNAHMFTLLQAALIDGGHLAGEPCDPEVVAVARGERPHERLLSDHARFNFVTHSGLNTDGSLDGFSSLIGLPVEGTPAGIQRLDSVPILLVGPNVLRSRAWDSNFFAGIHDALRSRAEVIEVLPAGQVADWLGRVRQSRR